MKQDLPDSTDSVKSVGRWPSTTEQVIKQNGACFHALVYPGNIKATGSQRLCRCLACNSKVGVKAILEPLRIRRNIHQYMEIWTYRTYMHLHVQCTYYYRYIEIRPMKTYRIKAGHGRSSHGLCGFFFTWSKFITLSKKWAHNITTKFPCCFPTSSPNRPTASVTSSSTYMTTVAKSNFKDPFIILLAKQHDGMSQGFWKLFKSNHLNPYAISLLSRTSLSCSFPEVARTAVPQAPAKTSQGKLRSRGFPNQFPHRPKSSSHPEQSLQREAEGWKKTQKSSQKVSHLLLSLHLRRWLQAVPVDPVGKDEWGAVMVELPLASLSAWKELPMRWRA